MKTPKHLIFLLLFVIAAGLLVFFAYREPKEAQAVFVPAMFERPNQDLLKLSILNPLLKDEVEFTDSREVTLRIIVGPKVKSFAVADSRDFSHSVIKEFKEDYTALQTKVMQKKWQLPGEFGEKEVCALAYTHYGQPSKPFCDKIEYVEELPPDLLQEKLAIQRKAEAEKRRAEAKEREAEKRRRAGIRLVQIIILKLPAPVLKLLPKEVFEGLPDEILEKVTQKILED